MTAYKVFVIDAQGAGWFRSQIEGIVLSQVETMLRKYHRKALCWMDCWQGMTLEDIREYEGHVSRQLAQRFVAVPADESTSETEGQVDENHQPECNIEGELSKLSSDLLQFIHPSEESTMLPLDSPLETRAEDLISEVINETEQNMGQASATRSGYLLKLGEGVFVSQTWNHRYLVLHNSLLRYYSDPRDLKPKEEIDLRAAEVCWAHDDDKNVHLSFVVSPSGTKRQIHFKGETEEETKQWMIWCQLAAGGCKTSLVLTEEELRNMQPASPKPFKNVLAQTRRAHLTSSPSGFPTGQTSGDLLGNGAPAGETSRAGPDQPTGQDRVASPENVAGGNGIVSACITELRKRSMTNYSLKVISPNIRVFMRNRQSPKQESLVTPVPQLGSILSSATVAAFIGVIFLISTVSAFAQGVAVSFSCMLEILTFCLTFITPLRAGLSDDSVVSMRASSVFVSVVFFLLFRLALPLIVSVWLLSPSLQSDERFAEEVLMSSPGNLHNDKARQDRNLISILPFVAKSICSVNSPPKEMFAVLMDHNLISEWSIGHEASMVIDTLDPHNDFLFETFRPSLSLSCGSATWPIPTKVALSCMKRRSLCRRRFWSEFPASFPSSLSDGDKSPNGSSGYVISLTSTSDADSRFAGAREAANGKMSPTKTGQLRSLTDLDIVPAIGVDCYIVSPTPDHPGRCVLTHLTGLRLGGRIPWWLSQHIGLSRACTIEGLRQLAESSRPIGGLSWVAGSADPDSSDTWDSEHAKRADERGEFDDLSEEELQKERRIETTGFTDGVETRKAWPPYLSCFSRAADGGLVLLDQEIMAAQKGVVLNLLKSAGKALLEGRNIVGISLPVRIFESKSLLERLACTWSMAPFFLTKAASTEAENTPEERFKHVITFVVASLHTGAMALKPFNPILGETYQGTWNDGTRVFLEHTSHHPPIAHFLLEGAPNAPYRFHGFYEFKGQLKGNYLLTMQDGQNYVDFTDGTRVEWNLPTAKVSGLIWGQRIFEWVDKIEFKDISNGLRCVLDMCRDTRPFLGPAKGPSDSFRGTIVKVDSVNEASVVANVTGSWLEALYFDSVCHWTLSLIHPINPQPVPDEDALPSDCRYRADVAHLKAGDQGLSQELKVQLEITQRADRAARAEFRKRACIPEPVCT
eukprot:GHVN01019321.1.p1 GENE.GHVN01019321.1~~GHVN01019321.1.p1  ORF type:complete len:1149 (-),score=124.97 GHVN01019321.1:1376-4822(-)